MAHTTDTLDQVKQRLAQNEAVLIDVREQDEWNEGHLAAATLVPLSELKAGVNGDALAQRIPKDQIVYLGRVISKEAIHIDPDKVKAIVDWPVPKSVRD